MLRISATLNLADMEPIQAENGFWPQAEGYPEKRLWAAVIVQTLTEYEYWLHMVRKNATSPVDCGFWNAIQSIRYEVSHPWFREVCALNDTKWSDVSERMAELDREYGLAAVQFTLKPQVRDSKHVIATRLRSTIYVN